VYNHQAFQIGMLSFRNNCINESALLLRLRIYIMIKIWSNTRRIR